MLNIFVFDIETIPDVATGRRIHNLSDDITDKDVAAAMFAVQREKNGREFLPLYLQRIVAISVVLRHKDQ